MFKSMIRHKIIVLVIALKFVNLIGHLMIGNCWWVAESDSDATGKR